MDHDHVARWIAAYERAWRSPGTDALNDLFTRDAHYSPAPFDDPVVGLPDIKTFWEAEREGPDETFSMRWDPVVVEARTAVVRVEVDYAGPPPRTYRDLWIIRFDERGRCTEFEEWPFYPEQPRLAS